ncbi:hypothetical protein [Nocardioides sp. TF02-7]|uniref:hypothetical protein n=1 Tax=Nocardioides sp. TF02-7 TaxID=2917724 RepID=UPI001F060A7E|nr:hypothetical protein [Nocardioides sp. TF02-7]UMG94322.1 hypothetical protein MF408_10115 [Nocardioides sp. TF02-7]
MEQMYSYIPGSVKVRRIGSPPGRRPSSTGSSHTLRESTEVRSWSSRARSNCHSTVSPTAIVTSAVPVSADTQ